MTKLTIAILAAKLPEFCFATLPGKPPGQRFAKVELFEGCVPLHHSQDVEGVGDAVLSALADGLNANMGVTRAQRAAMETGAMSGWESPAADPDHPSNQKP